MASCALCFADEDADMILAHAKTLYSQEGAKKALPEYERALASYQQAGNQLGQAITIGLIGNCYKKLGDYPKAIEMLNQSLAMKRELHARLDEGKTLSNLGLVYWEQGDYPTAIRHFNESIAIAQELHDIQLEASATNNLALVYDEQGQYRKSLELYQKALGLQRTIHFEPGEGDALGNIGGIYLSLGRFEECGNYYRQALEIDRRLQLKPRETLDIGNLAICQFGEGKVSEALGGFDSAQAMAQEAGMAKAQADWTRSKASALLRIGQVDAALKGYERSVHAYTQAGLKREESEALMDMGSVYFMLGDRSDAERSIGAAIKIAHDIGYGRGDMQDRLSLAEVLTAGGELHQAKVDAQIALAKARELGVVDGEVQALLLLARILLEQHLYAEAQVKAEEAKTKAEPASLKLLEGEALDLSGDLLVRSHEAEKALSKLESAKALSVEIGDVDMEWQTEYHLGRAFEQLDCDDDAVHAYRAAIEIIEDVRTSISERRFRTGYFQNKQRVYVALISLLLRMGKDGEAFGFSERLREYSFLQFRGGFPAGPDPRITETKARIRHLQDQLDSENDKSADERRGTAARTYSEELSAAQNELRVMLDSSAPDSPVHAGPNSFELIQSRLPARTALLEYVINENELLVFSITRSALHTLRVPIRERDLRSKIELLHDLLGDEESDAWRKPAESLRSIVVSPVEKNGWLKGISSLLIVPHGILNELPFAALPVVRDGKLAFLIEGYDLRELPSGGWLLRTWPTGAQGHARVLALAPGIAKLRFADAEAQSVVGIFGPPSVALLGARATETKFKQTAGQYDFIHLATHGVFNSSNPIFSGLQLEPDTQNDGRLEVHEILPLNLKARLITLSACDTALGAGDFANVPAGDEFIGLSRAFLEAGANAVVASLWKVDDRSTEILMDRLYRALRRQDDSHALGIAQRSMLADPQYRHPFYWAPFVLMGGNLNNSQLLAENR
jgi:CHAT domain-containing protein/Tfp pilus assembly protein PilF